MGLLDRLAEERAKKTTESAQSTATSGGKEGDQGRYYDEYESFRNKIHNELIRQAGSGEEDGSLPLREMIAELVELYGGSLARSVQRDLVNQIYDEAVGLGPLERLIKDDQITEIMVNGPKHVYIERKGHLELTDLKFRDDRHLMEIIERIVSSVGRRCDEASPMVDARLADGSRVNAIIPPVALSGASLTIRKFSKKPLLAQNLIDFGSASFQMLSFLEACVRARLNIIVCGGTGSGKTTLLNILSNYIPEDERIVTIEDSAELQLAQEHIVTLEARPANSEGAGEVSIRDLVRNALRMRPDRIVVGECRAGETLDMLQAMNTGHDGSLTTAHSNSARDLISRLETMVLMAGMELPVRAIREQITSAFDLIVHQARLRDGTRKIVEISEVVGMEGDVVIVQPIYEYVVESYDNSGKAIGTFRPTGVWPAAIDKMKDCGVPIMSNWFSGAKNHTSSTNRGG